MPKLSCMSEGRNWYATSNACTIYARGSGWYRVLQSSSSKLSAGSELRVRVLWKPAWLSLGACSVVPLRPQSNQILIPRSEVLHAKLERNIMKSWSSSKRILRAVESIHRSSIYARSSNTVRVCLNCFLLTGVAIAGSVHGSL
jgi:hypothetical protein